MKGKIVEEQRHEELPFPKLMVSKSSGVVYLMLSSGNKDGVAVSVPANNNRTVGMRYPGLDLAILEDFHGSVLLSNH